MKLRLLFLLLFLLIGIVAGCQQDKTVIVKPESQHSENKEVKQIIINEAPQNINSPSKAVLSQYEVEFENGEKIFPNNSSIISETILDSKSIVTIHSPEGENKYSIFLYEYKDNWIMNGFLRLEATEKESFTNKEGLDLPMDKFNANKMTLKENEEVWAFVDKKNIVTIARFDRFPFNENPGTRKISLQNGIEANISNDSMKNSYLYYFDSQKIIVVSGNVSEEEIINIANSLPSSVSPDFPSTKR